jgi:hypothetical protein
VVADQETLDRGQTISAGIVTAFQPKKSLSKQRKEYEIALFDIERKRHWKHRFVMLFGNIMRTQRRREKLITVLGFHKFLRNVALLSR